MRKGATFNSPEALEKMHSPAALVELEISFVGDSPDRRVSVKSKDPRVPVRISNSAPTGSTP